jgi:hypothetical protein
MKPGSNPVDRNVEPPCDLTFHAVPNTWSFRASAAGNWALPVDDTGWRRTPLPRLLAEGGPAYRDPAITTWSRDRIYYSQRHPGPDWTAIK